MSYVVVCGMCKCGMCKCGMWYVQCIVPHGTLYMGPSWHLQFKESDAWSLCLQNIKTNGWVLQTNKQTTPQCTCLHLPPPPPPQDPDEQPLQQYLKRARGPLGTPLYDPKYALQLVQERGCIRSTVFLLCQVGLYGDAVALALTFDHALAVAVANMPDDDAALQRRLWLAIARHVVEREFQTGGQACVVVVRGVVVSH